MAEESTVRIPLRQRDGSIRAYAIVDAEDAPTLTTWRWHLSNTGYAKRSGYLDGKSTTIFLHRAVMGLVHGDQKNVDHINGDRLDCRKANMRLATDFENAQNQVVAKSNRSGFRGVCWNKSHQLWEAYTAVDGRRIRLGYHKTAEEAHAAVSAYRATHLPFSTDALKAAA